MMFLVVNLIDIPIILCILLTCLNVIIHKTNIYLSTYIYILKRIFRADCKSVILIRVHKFNIEIPAFIPVKKNNRIFYKGVLNA